MSSDFGTKCQCGVLTFWDHETESFPILSHKAEVEAEALTFWNNKVEAKAVAVAPKASALWNQWCFVPMSVLLAPRIIKTHTFPSLFSGHRWTGYQVPSLAQSNPIWAPNFKMFLYLNFCKSIPRLPPSLYLVQIKDSEFTELLIPSLKVEFKGFPRLSRYPLKAMIWVNDMVCMVWEDITSHLKLI